MIYASKKDGYNIIIMKPETDKERHIACLIDECKKEVIDEKTFSQMSLTDYMDTSWKGNKEDETVNPFE